MQGKHLAIVKKMLYVCSTVLCVVGRHVYLPSYRSGIEKEYDGTSSRGL